MIRISLQNRNNQYYLFFISVGGTEETRNSKQISVIHNPCFWEYGSAAQGNKCIVQLKTNENDVGNQAQCIIND